MKPTLKLTSIAAATGLAGLLLAGNLHAVAYAWDGNGSPNTGGDWTTVNLWNPDGIPGTLAADTATLGDVTAGTRNVTLSTPQTIAAFNLTQTTAGVVNKFTLTSTLTTAAHTFSNVTAANVGTLVMELGTNGVFISNSSNYTGTIDFLGNGSSITKVAGGTVNLGNGQNGAVTVDVGAGNQASIARSLAAANVNHTVQVIGNTAGSRVATLDVKTGSLLIVGTTSSNFGGSSVSLITGDNATTTVRAGAEIKVESGAAAGATNSTTVGSTVNAGGTFIHSGTVSFRNQNNIAAGTMIIANNALYTVGSNSAAFIRSAGSNTNAAGALTFNNSVTGTFTSAGGGAASALSYTNNGSVGSAFTNLTFNNLGTIAVGGTSTSGLAGVGSLALTNVAMSTSAANANTMAFQVGGSTAGTFDAITFSGGSLGLASSADTLTLSLVNSFSPVSNFSISLLDFSGGATSTGAFDSITGIGAVSASSAVDVTAALGSFTAGDSWTFNNNSATADFGTLTYAVPEPTTWVLLTGGLTTMVVLRRRRNS